MRRNVIESLAGEVVGHRWWGRLSGIHGTTAVRGTVPGFGRPFRFAEPPLGVAVSNGSRSVSVDILA